MSKTKKTVVAVVLACVLIGVFITYFMLQQSSNKNTESTSKAITQPQSEVKDPSKHDYGDIDFAKKMILVDQQTSQIADIAAKNSTDEDVRNLAVKISEDAKSDSQKYIGWLNEWNEQYSNLSDFPEMEGHDMYPTFTGMISLSKIRAIDALTGTDFDKAFLSLMIEHRKESISLQSDSGEVSAVGFGEMKSQLSRNVNNLESQVSKLEQIKKDKGY